VVGDVQSSTDVVTSSLIFWPSIPDAKTLLGNHSDLFVVDAHSNISVFDSLSTHSLLSVLDKHANVVPLMAELASVLFLIMNGNDKAYHAFKHLDELEMIPKKT
jgi:hypothetical protein